MGVRVPPPAFVSRGFTVHYRSPGADGRTWAIVAADGVGGRRRCQSCLVDALHRHVAARVGPADRSSARPGGRRRERFLDECGPRPRAPLAPGARAAPRGSRAGPRPGYERAFDPCASARRRGRRHRREGGQGRRVGAGRRGRDPATQRRAVTAVMGVNIVAASTRTPPVGGRRLTAPERRAPPRRCYRAVVQQQSRNRRRPSARACHRPAPRHDAASPVPRGGEASATVDRRDGHRERGRSPTGSGQRSPDHPAATRRPVVRTGWYHRRPHRGVS